MIENIPDAIFGNPVATVGLIILIYLLLGIQRTLSFREFRTLQLLKIFIFPLLDSWATKRGRPLLRYKDLPETETEFIKRVEDSPRAVYRRFRDAGASPHLLATLKARSAGDRPQFAYAQMLILDSETNMQTEFYFFPAKGGGTDIYGHRETAVTSPTQHVGNAQEPAKLPDNF